jgi:uncharacterized membrane protein YjfL (UPF0719 family)
MEIGTDNIAFLCEGASRAVKAASLTAGGSMLAYTAFLSEAPSLSTSLPAAVSVSLFAGSVVGLRTFYRTTLAQPDHNAIAEQEARNLGYLQ